MRLKPLSRARTVIASVIVFLAPIPPLVVSGSTRFTMLSVVPVVAVGLSYGRVAGLAAGLLAYPLNVVLVWVVSGTPAAFLTSPGAAIGSVLTMLGGWLVGHLSERRDDAVRETLETRQVLIDGFEAAPIGMAVLSPSGEFRAVNSAFARMLDRPAEDIVHLNWRDISPHQEHPGSEAMVRDLFAGTTDKVEMDRQYIRGTGEVRDATLHLSIRRNPDGTPRHVLAHIADVTDLRRANAQLEELLTAKDRFIAGISHELRTPLTAVTGLAQELRDHIRDFTPGEVAEFAEIIASQSSDLSFLVEDFLTHARLESGLLAVTSQPVDLGAEVGAVLAGWTGAPVVRRIPDRAVEVCGDPHRVRQVIRNLLQNAVRHGGPRIEIHIRETERHGVISVVDNGEGAALDPDRLFDAPSGPVRRQGAADSVGVGLHLSRSLARMMGGDLTYRRADGETDFSLTLPLAPANLPTSEDYSVTLAG